MEATRLQATCQVVETECENGEGTVGPVRVGRGDGSAPVVVVEQVSHGSLQLDVGIGEDGAAETERMK